jgi:hypothetical protein
MNIKIAFTNLKYLFILIIATFIVLNYQESVCQLVKNKTNYFSGKRSQILQNFSQPYWITYFGGSNDEIFNFSLLDANNDIIAVGTTRTSNLPTQTTSYQRNFKGARDVYIARFDINGNLIWSTYLGGTGTEWVFKAGIDGFRRIWIVGETRSSDFPIYGTSFSSNSGNADGFIVCLDSDGKLILSTVLGGSQYDSFLDLAIKKNFIYVIGRSFSADFPTTNDAFQKFQIGSGYNGIIIKINLTDFRFYSTYIGLDNSGNTFLEGIAIDNDENIIVGGFTDASSFTPSNPFLNNAFKGVFDIWLIKFDKDFHLIWSALYGGSSIDRLSSIQCDSSSNIYVLGFTTSSDITFSNAIQNGFSGGVDGLIFKLTPEGRLSWGSFVGGKGIEGKPTSVDDFDRFMATLFLSEKSQLVALNFSTGSNDIFMNAQPSPFQAFYNGGSWDSYSLLIDYNGNPIYSTFLGGSLSDFSHSIFVKDSILLVSGSTESSNFPITSNAFQKRLNSQFDAFIAVFGISLPLDTIPPSVFSFTDSCGRTKTIVVTDTQNQKSGIKTITPKKLTNVSYHIVEQTQNKARIVVSLLDRTKMGYFAFEITDLSGNKRTIEDSLFSNYSALLSFSPKDSVFIGVINFDNLLCGKVWIKNFSADTLVLHKPFLRRNVDFSIPPSQLPLTIPPLDSTILTICFSPQMLHKWEYRDTLEIDEDCFFKRLIVRARLDTNFFGGSSNCNVQIKAKSAFEGERGIVMVSAPFPEKLVIQIEGKPDNVPAKVELFDVFGTQIRYTESNQNIIELDLSALARGIYFVRVETIGILYHSKVFVNE